MIFLTFFSRLNLPVTICSPIGNGERSIFEERIVDGVKKLVVTGKENLKEFIESSKADTLISNIMKRFENGDVNILSRVQGFYGDVTSMPSNLAECQNLLIKLENQFNSLPAETKAKFDNSFNKYVKDVSSMSIDDFNGFFNLKTVEKNLELETNNLEGEVNSNES